MAETLPLDGEHIIMTSRDTALSLSNLRVKYEATGHGTSTYKSIPLNKISCCSLFTKSSPLLLAIAALGLISCFVPQLEQFRIVGGVVAVVLVLAYFLTKRGRIQITSDCGEAISVSTSSLSHEEARKFVEAVALAIAKSS
jgi:hypothetical protein